MNNENMLLLRVTLYEQIRASFTLSLELSALSYFRINRHSIGGLNEQMLLHLVKLFAQGNREAGASSLWFPDWSLGTSEISQADFLLH